MVKLWLFLVIIFIICSIIGLILILYQKTKNGSQNTHLLYPKEPYYRRFLPLPVLSKEKVWKRINYLKKLFYDQKFQEVLKRIPRLRRLAKKYHYFGIIQKLDELEAQTKINFEMWFKNKQIISDHSGLNLAEAFFQIDALDQELKTQKTVCKDFQFPVEQDIKESLEEIKKRFEQDRTNTEKIFPQIDSHMNSMHFEAAKQRLDFIEKICKNYKFKEYYPRIEEKQIQFVKNLKINDDRQKALKFLENGELRLAYNAFDVLERETKTEKYKDTIVDPLMKKIQKKFKDLRNHIQKLQQKLHKKLWKVYKLTNQQLFDQAIRLIEEIEQEASKYDFFHILNLAKDARQDIKKIRQNQQ